MNLRANLSLVATLLFTASLVAQDAPPKPVIDVPTQPWTGKGEGNYVIGPDYTEAPEFSPRAGVPRGAIKTFTMESADSKRYPGIAKDKPGTVPYTRKCAVYIPARYKPGTAAPFIVLQDARNQKELPTVLDNMIEEGRLPVMVAVFIGNGGGDGKGSERGLEYDAVSGKYAEFVENEVLPKITADYGVKFTKDPDGRATAGCSSGAAAAFTMAWFHPDLYHRVLSYSGTYVAQEYPDNPASPHGSWEYHATFIPQSAAKPIRIWMQVGENDLRPQDPESTYHNWVLANGRMADALKAKGYHYQFVFSKGAKHCDGRVTHETLPKALEWLWQDYKPKK